MLELRKKLSENYLKMRDYFSETFSLLKKIFQKELFLLIGITVLEIGVESIPFAGILFGFVPIGLGYILIRKSIMAIEDNENENPLIGKSFLTAFLVCLVMFLSIATIIGIIPALVGLIYLFYTAPYFLPIFIGRNKSLKETWSYNKEIASNNRAKIIIPLLLTISPVLFSFPLIFIPIFGGILRGILGAIVIIISSVLYAIIYLNVEYMNKKTYSDNDIFKPKEIRVAEAVESKENSENNVFDYYTQENTGETKSYNEEEVTEAEIVEEAEGSERNSL